ncbi:MAG: Nif3-like dinuclear metal center hexameric protein [Clostridiaceae bacterium]|nr:Nif3-like dinuclear metal center hexameric protein [Clostridiaceae bacterium]
MVKLNQILSYLNELAPLTLQETYDNSGLILGNPETLISKVLVCLDADCSAVKKASDLNCQLVISHHPPIFQAVRVFTDETFEGRLLTLAIKNNIALYSIHTNFDSVSGGLADLLCKKIGLFNIKVIKPSPAGQEHGIGRYGTINPKSSREFITNLKNLLNLSVIRSVGKMPETITSIAVYNGSYDREIIYELERLKPDLLITGDLKYHDAQELSDKEIFTIDAGHFGTEKHFVEAMTDLVKEKFTQLDIIKHEGTDVFHYHID